MKKTITLLSFLTTLTACAGSPVLFQGDSVLFLKGSEHLPQISTPSNAASSYDKLYFKSDDKLYRLTSGGVETLIGPSASSGGSVINPSANTLQTFYVLVGSSCGSDPCTITDQSGTTGNTVSAVNRTASGHYVIHVVNGVCTGNISCVVDYNGTDNGGCASGNFQAFSATQYPVHCYSSAHSDQDISNGGWEAICQCKQ
jgi:hypothetical protein